MKKIWVKIFKCNNQTYCYDVGTNHIIQIDEILGEVLELFNYSNEMEVFSKLGGIYDKNSINKALKTINDFNKENGGFILEREMQLQFPFNKDDYEHIINNFLNQMVLNLTHDCNFRCSYCSYGGSYIYTRKHSAQTMQWKTIKKAIDFYLPRTNEYLKSTKKNIAIGFYGGEALLEKKNIFRAIDYIQSNYLDYFHRITFNLTTNGSLLDRDTLKKLVERNFSLTISLDGPKEIHNRYRFYKNGIGSFNTIIKNISWLRDNYPDYFSARVRFNTVMAPTFKIKEIRNFFLENFPGQNLSVAPLNPFDTVFFDKFDMKETLVDLKRDIEEIRREYLNKQKKGEFITDTNLFEYFLFDFYNRELFELPEVIYPNGICPPTLKRILVEVDGTIHMCERINPGFSIGDIKNGFDINKIFNYIHEYIKTTENCVGCWAVRFCKDCFITAIKGDKFNIERKRLNCTLRREKTLDEMTFFTRVMEQSPGVLDNIKQTTPDDDIIKIGYDFLSKNKNREEKK